MINFCKKRKIAVVLFLCLTVTCVFSGENTVFANVTVSDNKVPVEQDQVSEVQVSENSAQEEEAVTAEAVTGVSVVSDTYKSLRISFLQVPGAAGYEIYRGTSKTKQSRIADVKPNQTTYIDKGKKSLTTGKKYYYKVRAYVYDTQNQKVYGEFSKIVSGKPMLAAPVVSEAKGMNYKSVQISYGKVDGAKGYVIYRSTKKDSGFKKIATVKKATTLQYTDKKCKTGTTYYYKVRAYRKVSGKNKYSPYSEPVKAKTKLNSPKLIGVMAESADTALVTWKKVSGASGYRIYRSETKKGKYKKVADIKGGSVTQTYVGGQENGKTYYYKIRAYRTIDKKRKYSGYSGIKKAVFNRLASANETYSQKAQRIFGLDYYKKYMSQAEAELHMVTITVPVWDFAPDGVTKVTKQRSITVHKNIADTVKQIFKEIYEGEERFPIKNVGGYSWRGESSRSEHCCGVAIDINWEENYLIDNGVIISGKCYLPGVNPYSIPTDGEVAKIMNKYGFSQGLWGNRCDYMHFSYFGT